MPVARTKRDVMSERLSIETTDTATVVRLNTPDTKNRLDDGMVTDLHAALDTFDTNKILAFRGNGDGFSAGRPHSPGGHPDGPAAAKLALEEVVRLNLRIAQWAAPTVGFVHGYANGAALGILQHMDIVVAAKGAKFSFPEITYHLPPSLVASYLGTKTLEKATRYLIMTGKEVDADRALEMGLVSIVVEPSALDAEAASLLTHLGERLEAELAMKETLNEFAPARATLGDDMTRGMGAVLKWARRPKKA
jgi:enoyl-CoA hydratase/carnithine racemase